MKAFFFLLTVLALALCSCQKVIQVDLNSASPAYVIEAEVNNSSNPGQVRLTQSKNFDEDNTFPSIPNALIIISDNAGQRDTLDYYPNGFYKTSTLQGIPGRTYYLSVLVNGQSFSASCTLPQPVAMDSLYQKNEIIFGDTIQRFYAIYKDPAGVPNYYRFLMFYNGQRQDNIFINKDQYNDGKTVERGFSYQNTKNNKLQSGDSIRIRMQCIEEAVYTYFYTLDETIGQSSASPANPKSNISGGALGYFNACTVQNKTILIP